jgi:hypothetical protein
MAHSYIEYRGDGFIANDLDIHVLVGLLISAAKPQNLALDTEILESWNAALTLSGAGAIDLELDKLLGDEETKIRHVCSILAAAKQSLAVFGETISSDQLNALVEGRVEFVGARNTKDYEKLLDRLASIIRCTQ